MFLFKQKTGDEMRISDWSSDVCSSDIGTVIAPDADAKLFVTASPAVRAARRHAELQAGGGTRSLEAVLGDIYARDARDSNRAAAPLVQADDADLLDTTELGITDRTSTRLNSSH